MNKRSDMMLPRRSTILGGAALAAGAAADAAHRAIMNPRCQPWPLSPEKYNSWRNITFNFDPRDY